MMQLCPSVSVTAAGALAILDNTMMGSLWTKINVVEEAGTKWATQVHRNLYSCGGSDVTNLAGSKECMHPCSVSNLEKSKGVHH